MAVPAYSAIYGAVNGGAYWQTLAISVAMAQKARLAGANPTAAEIAWAKRDPGEEARRIIFYVIGTDPILSKLDAPGTITDADFDTALGNVLPSLLKAVL
jgi:hypothetical protein